MLSALRSAWQLEEVKKENEAYAVQKAEFERRRNILNLVIHYEAREQANVCQSSPDTIWRWQGVRTTVEVTKDMTVEAATKSASITTSCFS